MAKANKRKHGITDDGAKALAIVIIKQAVWDWKQVLREPYEIDGMAELRRYFRSGECTVHCLLAGIEQDQLIRKMEQLRKQLK